MEEKPPLPLPEGKTLADVKMMRVNEGEWRKDDRFICRRCGEPAFIHPYTNNIWGCKKCEFTTYSVAFYFKDRTGVIVP